MYAGELMDNKHAELKKMMQERFASAQAKNSSFSLRSFAKFCEISPSAMSEFFNNKRQFSDKKINELLERLGLSPEQINSFQDKHKDSTVILNSDVARLKLDTDLFFLVSHPIYYSILSLIETKGFKYDLAYIADRLGEREQEVAAAITRLLELSLIKETKNGNKKGLKLNTHHLDAITGIPSSALRVRHQLNLDQAAEALHNLPITERFFSFETLAIEKSKLPEAQELFYKFFDELHKLSSPNKKDEVYEFCFHYFPRSKNSQ